MSRLDKQTRYAVLQRDNFTCQLCGVRKLFGLTVDHIKPRSHGGTDLISNLRAACRTCNTARSNRAERTLTGGYVR